MIKFNMEVYTFLSIGDGLVKKPMHLRFKVKAQNA
jgi:hypothetical protein